MESTPGEIFNAHMPIQDILADAAAGDDADDGNSGKDSPTSVGEQGSAKGRGNKRSASLPCTPRPAWGSPREYASDRESWSFDGRRRRRWMRERRLDRAWDMRRCQTAFYDSFLCGAEGGECLVVVRPRGSTGRRICMDLEEVKACRDLGLQIPRDFTVEIPGGLSGNSSSGDSPTSGTGEVAKEIKAKLKVWAHAVAYVSSAARAGR